MSNSVDQANIIFDKALEGIKYLEQNVSLDLNDEGNYFWQLDLVERAKFRKINEILYNFKELPNLDLTKINQNDSFKEKFNKLVDGIEKISFKECHLYVRQDDNNKKIFEIYNLSNVINAFFKKNNRFIVANKQNNDLQKHDNIKNFSKPDQEIQKINDLEKNSKDATRIYELIAKTQKLEIQKNIIGELSRTDYLEKVLYSLKDYKGKIGLTIKDLRNFLDSSIDPIETTRALINYYDSKGRIGKNYLDKFAFGQNLKPESETYADLEQKGLVEVAQDVRKYSANLKIQSVITTFFGSAVLFEIDRENNIAYYLTNEHVINKENLKELKFQLMNLDLKEQTGKAEIVGFSNEYDIGVIAIKLSQEDIKKMDEPKMREDDKYRTAEDIILVGNYLGLGYDDFSTNVTFGKGFKFPGGTDLLCDLPAEKGNSGGGVFDKEGELIGIIYKKDSGEKYSVPISIAAKEGKKIIEESKLKNKMANQNPPSDQKEILGEFTKKEIQNNNNTKTLDKS